MASQTGDRIDANRYSLKSGDLPTSGEEIGGRIALASRRTGFYPRDLIDAPRVTAAFKRRLQPDADHALDEFLAQQVGGQTQHVCVVVPPAHFRRDIIVTRRRPHAADLIGGNAHAY